MRTAWAAKSRMELLSANIAAEGILRQWPDAALPADGVLGPEVRGALTPWAILDTDGEVRDDDREMWDELDIGADVTGVISNLSDGGGDCWSTRRSQCPGPICCSTGPCRDLKTAAAITTEQNGSRSARRPACGTFCRLAVGEGSGRHQPHRSCPQRRPERLQGPTTASRSVPETCQRRLLAAQ